MGPGREKIKAENNKWKQLKKNSFISLAWAGGEMGEILKFYKFVQQEPETRQ